MPKMKTTNSILSKFKVTGKGKLLRRKPGKRHLLTGKSSKRKRQLGRPAVFEGKQADTYKRLMGV